MKSKKDGSNRTSLLVPGAVILTVQRVACAPVRSESKVIMPCLVKLLKKPLFANQQHLRGSGDPEQGIGTTLNFKKITSGVSAESITSLCSLAS